jgi:hypothetical protein
MVVVFDGDWRRRGIWSAKRINFVNRERQWLSQ